MNKHNFGWAGECRRQRKIVLREMNVFGYLLGLTINAHKKASLKRQKTILKAPIRKSGLLILGYYGAGGDAVRKSTAFDASLAAVIRQCLLSFSTCNQ